MSTNVKRATRKGLLPDYHSILAIIFNIIHVFFSKTFFVLFLFSLQHGGQIRSSSCVTSRESGLLCVFACYGIITQIGPFADIFYHTSYIIHLL